MLKHWLDKMKNFFVTEVEEEIEIEDPDQPNQNRQQLKARMTYQYPENRPFRFPVIPDQREARKKDEDKQKPAYTRRKQEPVRKPEKSRNTTASTAPRKVYKDENAPPFQASEVPSPIYGFQKRTDEVENIPAYARKKIEKEEQLEVQEEERKPIESAIREIAPEQKTALQETAVTVEAEEPQQKEEKTKTEEIKTIQQLAQEETTDKLVHKKAPQPEKNKTSNERKQGNKREVPFNVMMTPLDKAKMERNERVRERGLRRPEKRLERERERQPENETVQPVMEQVEVEETPKDIHIPLHLLNDPQEEDYANDPWIQDQQNLLEQTLKHFNVAAKVVLATQGPSVTRFEVQPELGVKVSKIRNLSDDLKLNMSARDIRIEAPIPGKNTVGIEVPNPTAQMVGLQEIVETDEFKESKSPLTAALGLTIEGKPKITNIQKMPHGLIAGATGSGKSVCINTILISVLYKASHEDVKLLLIDPKMVELAPYNGVPHLVSPVITDVKAATQSLKWAVNEMEERYERFVEEGVRDIERFNRKVNSENRSEEKMPYILIVIDELADLMMMSPQDVENSISRIAQKARACGIHLLLATQRPSVDVITGLIKANIPTRIAFSVSSQVDSRTILDVSGAEKLLGKGDMLFMENGTGKSVRLQGPFVSDEEIERVTAYAREIAEPEYLFEQEQLLEQIHLEEDEDELLEEAIQFVIHQQSASTSMLQRHFKIGYNRAARLIDTLEARGIISGQNGSKPRDVLVTETAAQISE
ncbi:DNA translocase FtsK [Oceanobacillus alkalisoli]|uniref:DNA translocase FtsK n=1 Tax=Oceanobacillus alkalisoli TaxID=2925113 RepID=UPI001EEFEDA0|nr:DNA translocase FtsK [Oceanobacillus alkalisoli]MCF3943283.1 DNA translocase FtsK [Oceanobacillus alkalisoli]MCG5103840.1 DNA translocase FtsK [Oceanobacillus alkalisoli]